MILIFSIVWAISPFQAYSQSKNDIDVTVNSQLGNYSITSAKLGWAFDGSIGQAVTDVQREQGRDTNGAYKKVSFKWNNKIDYTAGSIKYLIEYYIGSIKWYLNKPVILFSLTLPEGASQSPVAFPDFKKMPDLPYRFSYRNHIFATPQFFLQETSTPWLLFNDKAEACVISPASDFIVSRMRSKDSTNIRSGLNREITNLQPGFTHSTIMVFGNGIRKAWDEWGNSLRQLYHRKRPGNDSDVLLKYYGYWTDNGSDYYYNYDSSKGYAGTLLSVRKHYKQEGIPLGYMQLDSWWYEKSRYNIKRKYKPDRKNPKFTENGWNRSGGMMRYKADPLLFPDGLASFQQKLGLPLVTHNRWIDPRSPYHKKYKISGLSAIDPAFWKHIMNYLEKSGVTYYEQDWMNYMYFMNPEMKSNVDIGNAFTDGMAQAAQANGINMQYCMALPRYFMQGLKYNNLTTIRPSGDGFMPKRWMNFIFTSQLAYEMGIWPWSDVFKSSERGNMIVSVLSAGPVGTGDALGKEDKANIMRTCRNDGVLVKPDAPLLPMDQVYIQMARGECKPVLSYTYTQHGNIRTNYVFAFSNSQTKNNQFEFRPADIGMSGSVVLYQPESDKLDEIQASATYRSKISGKGYNNYILAPVTSSGIAFLGDENKIVATGKKRIKQISSSGNTLQIKVVFASGEQNVMLHGYCRKPVRSDKGKLTNDESEHQFSLVVSAPDNGNEVIVSLKS